MFLRMISPSRITAFFPSCSEGISTILGRTEGTCTVANSSFSFFRSFLSMPCFLGSSRSGFLRIRAPIFRDLFLIRGKGREESMAMGVTTG